jgi:crotonobetainyl-CoA:carnitine CoA-transferase CaiB-like acyl-CoA transferase
MSQAQESVVSLYEGLRVLDLASNLAGPLAAMVLGDLGADVIKVERPDRGDDTRDLVPRWDGQGTVFLSVNRNKRSVGLDLGSDQGREALLALVETADVVIESFGPGVAERLGIAYERMHQRNPAVIHCSVSAFGQGPVGRRRPGYDALVQGFSGMLSITGHPDGPPARVAPSSIDLATGLWAVIAIQAALARRGDTGKGTHIDVALLDTAFNLMSHQVLGMLATGVPTPRYGTESPSSTPNGAYETADGWLVVATANDRLFARLCQALELPELSSDPRYISTEQRVAAREELQSILRARFRQRTTEDWVERLRSAGVPVGPLHDLRQALEDPLTSERRLLVVPPGDDGPEQIPQMRIPIDPTGASIRRPPPAVGEHTREVLREVGLPEALIRRLAVVRKGFPPEPDGADRD